MTALSWHCLTLPEVQKLAEELKPLDHVSEQFELTQISGVWELDAEGSDYRAFAYEEKSTSAYRYGLEIVSLTGKRVFRCSFLTPLQIESSCQEVVEKRARKLQERVNLNEARKTYSHSYELGTIFCGHKGVTGQWEFYSVSTIPNNKTVGLVKLRGQWLPGGYGPDESTVIGTVDIKPVEPDGTVKISAFITLKPWGGFPLATPRAKPRRRRR